MKRRKRKYKLGSVAAIGNHLPRQCGIATFTTDLCQALAGEMKGDGQVVAVAMDDVEGGYPYPERVKFQLRANVQGDYLRAADFLNVNQFEVAILQHEYGIFGGKSGVHILHLVNSLRMPVLATLHTVLAEPSDEERAIIIELAKRTERLIVMSQKGREMLVDIYSVPEKKIACIPHGIPDVPFVDTSFHKDRFGVEAKKVLLTFGLLSPGKGIDTMIEALPKIVQSYPDVVYIVLGATHPQIKRTHGEAYRHRLQQRVTRLDMEDYVLFHNQFVSLEVLCEYIGAADLYVTPYRSEAQVVSGTLAYALGAGKAVVSTPYWYAQELLAEERGRIVPVGDSGAMADAIIELLSDDLKRNAMRKRAYQYCRPMVWQEVARSYLELAGEVLDHLLVSPKPRPGEEGIGKTLEEMPEPNLRHLWAMTDDTGMLRHASYATPEWGHGYSSDDNARALIATSMYYALRQDESVVPAIQRYLSFLLYAFNAENRRFRNMMFYDRRWEEEAGSEDCHARVLWGLGVAMKCAPNDAIRGTATRLFLDGLEVVESLESPRAWAFALVGLHAYLEVYGGDAAVRRLRVVLAERLQVRFDENMDDDWVWFEDVLTYANATPPYALILAGQWIPNARMQETGLKALKWLLDTQTAPGGHLSIVGNRGWYPRGGERASFDQEPLEVMELIQACAEALRFTGDKSWLRQARRCLTWFLGYNDLNVQMYDFKTGGCCDSLMPNGPNANQGARATLAWLMSLFTMYDILGQEILVAERGAAR